LIARPLIARPLLARPLLALLASLLVGMTPSAAAVLVLAPLP